MGGRREDGLEAKREEEADKEEGGRAGKEGLEESSREDEGTELLFLGSIFTLPLSLTSALSDISVTLSPLLLPSLSLSIVPVVVPVQATAAL